MSSHCYQGTSIEVFTSRSRTSLVEQPFGQYMEDVSDIASPKDIYEWLEGPLVEAVQRYAGTVRASSIDHFARLVQSGFGQSVKGKMPPAQ